MPAGGNVSLNSREYVMSFEGYIPLIDRLFKRAVPHGKCLLWVGKKDQSGYGTLRLGSKNKGHHQIGAHKLAYVLMKADVPPGMHVLHSCDNPACINPMHLSVGTPRDNQRDAMNKNRHSSQQPWFARVTTNLLPSTKSSINPKWCHLIVTTSTRQLALQSGKKRYVGSVCPKHNMAIRQTSNGECIYCRYEYRNCVKLVPNYRR